MFARSRQAAFALLGGLAVWITAASALAAELPCPNRSDDALQSGEDDAGRDSP